MFLRGGMILFNSVIPLASTLLPGLIINELISEQRINIIWLYVGILVLSSDFQYIRPVNIQADLWIEFKNTIHVLSSCIADGLRNTWNALRLGYAEQSAGYHALIACHCRSDCQPMFRHYQHRLDGYHHHASPCYNIF